MRTHFLALFSTITLLLSGCSSEIRKGSETVDVEPLFKTQISLGDAQKISDLIDLSVFDTADTDETLVYVDWYGAAYGNEEDLPNISPSDMIISFELAPDSHSAELSFMSFCDSYFDHPSDIIYGGSKGNQYCISYVAEIRDSVEGFWRPTGIYKSFVAFQKDRLVITILEHTTDLLSTKKDDVILLFAKMLGK